MSSPVVHFEIAGRDGARTRDFYSKIFNWQYQMFGDSGYGMVNANGPNSIGGGVCATQPNTPPYTVFYVQVDDLQATLNHVEQLGGKTLLPPTPIPGMGAFAWFADPDGLTVGIYRHGE